MTDVAAAALATGKFFITRIDLDCFRVLGGELVSFKTHAEAVAACDRLNLLAVLEALREPSEGMVAAGVHRARRDQIPGHVLAVTWRTMIDALIAEVAGNGDANDDG